MSDYVYQDKFRKDKIYAKDANDKTIRYYCPDVTCDAHMSLKTRKENYFAACFSHSHREGCRWYNKNNCSLYIGAI